MIKLVIVGAWACLITLASSYATTYLHASLSTEVTKSSSYLYDSRKTPEINIPKIRQGIVTGYVVAQFDYDLNRASLASLPFSPDAIVVNEAFKFIYDDDSIDFSNLKRINLSSLTETIRKNANARLGSDVVTNMTVEEMTFLSRDQTDRPL